MYDNKLMLPSVGLISVFLEENLEGVLACACSLAWLSHRSSYNNNYACELSAHTCKLFLGQKWFQMGLMVPRRLGEKLKLQKIIVSKIHAFTMIHQ